MLPCFVILASPTRQAFDESATALKSHSYTFTKDNSHEITLLRQNRGRGPSVLRSHLPIHNHLRTHNLNTCNNSRPRRYSHPLPPHRPARPHTAVSSPPFPIWICAPTTLAKNNTVNNATTIKRRRTPRRPDRLLHARGRQLPPRQPRPPARPQTHPPPRRHGHRLRRPTPPRQHLLHGPPRRRPPQLRRLRRNPSPPHLRLSPTQSQLPPPLPTQPPTQSPIHSESPPRSPTHPNPKTRKGEHENARPSRF